MRRRLWVAGAVLVALALVVGGLLWWRGHDDRTSFAWAVGHAPAGTQRASWTDWAAVRAHEGAHLSAASSTGDLRRFLRKAFDDDLSSASALVGSAPVLQQRFGFSPANVDWELFSQSEQGAVVMLQLPSADLESVPDHLRALGYQEPSDAGGVWNGGSDLVRRPVGRPHPRAVLRRRRQRRLAGPGFGLRGVPGRRAAGGARRRPARDGAGRRGRRRGRAVVVGGLHRRLRLRRARDGARRRHRPGRGATAAGRGRRGEPLLARSRCPTSPTARSGWRSRSRAPTWRATNADARAVLAQGPAPGQGGSFADRFAVDAVTADGSLVVMRLTPRAGAYVLSDLSTGPVLFATC